MSARGFLGAGDLYIARFNPATQQFDAFKGPYEATRFEITPNIETRELSSRGRSTYGQVIESVTLPQPSDFAVDLPEVNKESLTIALLGTDQPINQGSGTATNEPITARKGAWVPLAFQNVSASGFAITNTAGTTTYVQGTDYEVNYRMGWVRILEGSAIAEGATLHVDYTYNAVSGTMIRGATQSQLRVKLRLDGVNFADQSSVIVDVFEAVIAPDSAFNFLSDEFATVTLPGRLKTPVGRTEPFTVSLLN